MQAHLCFLFLLFLQPWLAASDQMPRFVYAQSAKMLLVWNDVWEAGTQNSLVLLSNGNRITIRVRVDGVTPGSGLKRILACSCPTKTSVDEIDLDALTSSSSVDYCTTDIPFTLRKSATSSDDFELTMSASKITYLTVFTSRVVLSVRAQYSGGMLQSNSLSVWNLDPISNFPSSGPSGFERRFLTDNAIPLLTRMNLGTGDFHNFQFIEPSLMTALQAAPNFFKQKVNLGALLNFDATPCSSIQYDKSMLFATYHTKLSTSQMEQLKTMVLNRKTGMLWYARCQLYKTVRLFYESKGSPPLIGICSAVTFSGDVVPLSQMSDVRTRMTSSEFSYSGCSDAPINACTVVPDTQQNVTIYSGMDNTQLVCPIICSDPTMVYRFYHNDRQLLPPTSADWGVVDGVRISRSSNIVELPGGSSASQSGVYRCEASTSRFSFYVTVVSMPSFDVKIGGQDGTVPPRVFAMQGESLSYSCGVSHSGLSTAVSLQPQFFLPSVSGSGTKWTQYSLDGFNSLVSSGTASAVAINVSSAGAEAQLMNVSIQSVPPLQVSLGYNFTHRFVCNATVSGTDATNLGMATYGAQSGGDVVFVSRPTKDKFVIYPGNDCVTQKCHLGNGATFRFSLSPQYADYLASIGVDVVSFLRIDNLLLTDIKVLIQSNVSTISSNASTSSLVYRLLPIWSSEVRTELQKRSSLTPVFNLRYRNSTDMGNVQLLKSRHGSATFALGAMDCRKDPLCFYSTDFDESGSLSFLTVSLDFNEPTPPVAGADLTIMIVVIVVCVVLIVLLVVLVVYFAKRPPAKTYELEEKEIEHGRNPTEEAKDENFKDYTRQSRDYTSDPRLDDGNGDIAVPAGEYQNYGFDEPRSHTSNAGSGNGNGDIAMRPSVYRNDAFYESLGPEDVRLETSDQV